MSLQGYCMIEALYPGYNAARILHEYPSFKRLTPFLLGNAVAGRRAVLFYLPSVPGYIVFRLFEGTLKAIYSRLTRLNVRLTPDFQLQKCQRPKHDQIGDLVYPPVRHAVKSPKVLVISGGFPLHLSASSCTGLPTWGVQRILT